MEAPTQSRAAAAASDSRPAVAPAPPSSAEPAGAALAAAPLADAAPKASVVPLPAAVAVAPPARVPRAVPMAEAPEAPAFQDAVTRGTKVAGPLSAAAGHAAVGGISETSAAGMLAASVAAPTLAQLGPAPLPALPGYLSVFSMYINVPSKEALESCLTRALSEARFDAAWQSEAWVAHGWLYVPRGCLAVTLRPYALPARPAAAGAPRKERYAVELIRNWGSHELFAAAFDAVLLNLEHLQDAECPSKARLVTVKQLAAEVDAERAGSSSGGSGAVPGLADVPSVPACNFRWRRELLSGAPADEGVVDAPPTATEAAEPAVAYPGAPPMDTGFKPLNDMLRQPYDELCTSAAESVCSLLAQLRVRRAIGASARKALTEFQEATDAGTPAASFTFASVLLLVDAVLKRAINKPVALAVGSDSPAVTSTACRTLAAMALANLARDVNGAGVLLALRAHVGIFLALQALAGAVDPALRALRRELVRTLRNLVAHGTPEGAKAAAEVQGHPGTPALFASFAAVHGDERLAALVADLTSATA